MVDSDSRYSHGDVECIDAIRAALTPDEFRGFCKGNVVKYVWREAHKGGDADLLKARDYIYYAAPDTCTRTKDGTCSGCGTVIMPWYNACPHCCRKVV